MEFINGSIFESNAQVIGLSCNICGNFNSIISQQFADNVPIIFNSYKNLLRDKGPSILGRCQLINIEKNYVALLFSQKDCGDNNYISYTDYEALRSSLSHLRNLMIKFNLKSVAFPHYLGYGLIGGDKDTTSKIINEQLGLFKVEIWNMMRS